MIYRPQVMSCLLRFITSANDMSYHNLSLAMEPKLEFPKIRSTLFWGRYNKDPYLGYDIRVPYFRKLPSARMTSPLQQSPALINCGTWELPGSPVHSFTHRLLSTCLLYRSSGISSGFCACFKGFLPLRFRILGLF